MAKDSGGMLNILLIGGAAYLAWQWYQGQSITAAAPVTTTGTTPPVGSGTTTTNTGASAPPASPTTVSSFLGTPGTPLTPQFLSWLSAKGITGSTPISQSDFTALVGQYTIQMATTTPTPPATPAPTTGTVGGVAYSGTKNSYNNAVISALIKAANGSQSQTIDEWNWFMANSLGFTGFDQGTIDPDQVIGVTGTGRNDAISPSTYINALMTLGQLPYPTGLTGLAALAAGINRINRHPLAQRAPGNQLYLKPRKVVM